MVSIPVGNGWLQISTGAWAVGSVFVGGQHAYIEVLDATGAHDSMIPAVDDLGNPVDDVLGLAVNPANGTLYAVLADSEIPTDAPYDVAVFPDGSGILTAHLVDTGDIELRKYSLDGLSVLDTWTPTVPAGYGRQPIRVDIACDSESVILSWSINVLTRFNLTTGLDVADYETLGTDIRYLYGAVKWASRETGDSRDAVFPMTRGSGHGPQRAVALGSGGALWTDEINPTGSYHVVKRRLSDGDFLASFVTQADEVPTNDRTLSLSVYFNACAARRRHVAIWNVS